MQKGLSAEPPYNGIIHSKMCSSSIFTMLHSILDYLLFKLH